MRPGPGLVVMALAFISGARRGSTSTSTSQQKISSLTSSSSSSFLSSSSASSSLSSSSKSPLLLYPSNDYHFYQQQQQQQQQQLPPEQRTRSDRHPSYSLSSSSFSSSSSKYSSTSSLPDASSPALSSSYSLFNSFKPPDSSPVASQLYPSSLSLSSSLSSDYRNSFTIYNHDRNNDDTEHNYHFDNFKLDKISYVNVEDYGENREEISSIIGRGVSGRSVGKDEFESDDLGSGFFFGGIHSYSHILESTSSLSRVNPWLSACDLAQPSSAPDLQGQCTAGSLPVAWVDEGPGPPSCPMSCEQLRLENNYNSNSNSNKNKLHNYDNNNLIKLNNNNNFNPVHNIMSKVRRETVGFHGSSSVSGSAAARATTTAPSNAAAAKSSYSYDSSQITTIKPPEVVERRTTTVSTASINANKMVADKTVETKSEQKHQQKQHQQKQEHQQHKQLPQNSQSDTQPSPQDYQYNYNKLKNYNNVVKLNSNNNKNNQNNNVNNNKLINDNSNQFNQNQQQQQCLDYLGDNDDSSPTQLCKNSRSDLANKLRTLRLKHCCERTVFSALHTIALNATLSDESHCVRILTDILDLDILATRITCELAEILFRYDCRQIYSLIHQCKDCKEAYRRWVCSTLIPFFAEHSSTSSAKDSANTPTTKTAATSNSTNKYKNNNESNNSDQYSLNHNDENFERDKTRLSGVSAYDDENSVESPKMSSLTSSILSIKSLTSTITEQQNQRQQSQEIQQTPAHQIIKRAKGDNCVRTKSNSKKQINNADERETSTGRQSEDSISTANNEDLCVEGPVISRLLKRTKRKIEFRKRRRIRPCRSICQTVEQKCPYLLPGDRAPAYPTQYAGEPTFLCLDQNIPETGEQLLKSNHGPPECCYRYCGQPEYGICVYCDGFDDGSGKTTNTTDVSSLQRNATNSTLNDRLVQSLSPIKLQENSKYSGLSSSDKSLNTTTRTNTTTITRVADVAKLPYYAYTGQVYYYDDVIDLPSDPIAECQPVASTTPRCTMPYYPSSSATKLDERSLVSQRCMLIWTSIFWYLVNNYILVTVHNINDSKYRFYYYCCYNLNDWWRRLIVLIMTVVSL